MNAEQLAEIKARCDAAPDRPWCGNCLHRYEQSTTLTPENTVCYVCNQVNGKFERDADIPKLLDEVARLQARVAKLEAEKRGVTEARKETPDAE